MSLLAMSLALHEQKGWDRGRWLVHWKSGNRTAIRGIDYENPTQNHYCTFRHRHTNVQQKWHTDIGIDVKEFSTVFTPPNYDVHI